MATEEEMFTSGRLGDYVVGIMVVVVAVGIIFGVGQYVLHALNTSGIITAFNFNNYGGLIGTVVTLSVVALIVIVAAWMIGLLRGSFKVHAT